jgi:hypothetical protein
MKSMSCKNQAEESSKKSWFIANYIAFILINADYEDLRA